MTSKTKPCTSSLCGMNGLAAIRGLVFDVATGRLDVVA